MQARSLQPVVLKPLQQSKSLGLVWELFSQAEKICRRIRNLPISMCLKKALAQGVATRKVVWGMLLNGRRAGAIVVSEPLVDLPQLSCTGSGTVRRLVLTLMARVGSGSLAQMGQIRAEEAACEKGTDAARMLLCKKLPGLVILVAVTNPRRRGHGRQWRLTLQL